MLKIIRNTALILVLVLSLTAQAEDLKKPADPHWPLDLSTRYLTSNFMEFRGGRFHAGLDLKTQSREGFTVRATEDGYIARLRCTPTAYGRVIYLRGDSGRTHVFAHLNRFNDELHKRVQQAQQKSGRYRTSLEFKAGQIRVKKGQVLGLSGQSGTGGPHLHFEVRDQNQRPLNPLDCGFVVNDTIAPVIHSLRAWPADETARINGQPGEWVLAANPGRGLAGDLGVLQVNGPVAFSARMVDASDIRGHKLEPWLIEVELDGEVVYRCRNERYAFDENALQRLEWTDWADWTEEGVSREHWLFRRSANTLTGREGGLWHLGAKGQGLEPGDHVLKLLAQDHAGAKASVSWTLRVGGQAPMSTSWQQQWLGVNPGPGTRLTPFYSSGEPGDLGFEVRKLNPGDDPVLESMELWTRHLNYDEAFVELGTANGLQPAGPAAFFVSADWPIESSVPVDFPAGVAPVSRTDKLGVYRLKRKTEWTLVESLGASGETGFRLSEPGFHAVFRDTIAPVFQTTRDTLQVVPNPRSTVAGITLPRWQTTPVVVDDLGSGVDTGTLKGAINGQKIIVEPDPPRNRVLINWPDSLEPGDHHLTLEAGDEMGNVGRVRYQVLLKLKSLE